tara:strand:- start:163 stop:432 length:270 start_codon:yes stop_codon:yes gene_type:complete
MAKKAAVKEKYTGKKGDIGMRIETPYPPEHYEVAKKSAAKKKKEQPPLHRDVNFIGNELVKLTNRVNELELSLEEMRLKVKTVSGRMGL